VIDQLAVVRDTHDDERAKMKFGSQKAFFAKIWSRLHDNRPYDPVAVRTTQSSSNKPKPKDGSMPNSQRNSSYAPGISNSDISFMACQMGGQEMLGQMPMMGGTSGYPNPMMGGMGQSMIGGPQNMGMMGQNMNMGMMPYQDQYDQYPMMGGGFSNMQYGGRVGNGSAFGQTGVSSKKRDMGGDDLVGSNKRIREI
jgi:hypothetical protein